MGRPCKCCNKEDCENCQCFDSYKFEEDPDRYDWMLVICNSNAIQDDLWDLYIQHPTRDEEDEVEYYIGAVDNIGKDECSSNIFCTNEEMIEEAKDFCDLQLCCINNAKITVVDKDIFNFCNISTLRFVCTEINNYGNFGSLTVIRRDKQRGGEYCRLLSTQYSAQSPPETGSSFSINFIQECCSYCGCGQQRLLSPPPFRTRPFYIGCTFSDFSATTTSFYEREDLSNQRYDKSTINRSLSINSSALSSMYYSELYSKDNPRPFYIPDIRGTDSFCFIPGTREYPYNDSGLDSYDPFNYEGPINNPLFTRTNFEKDIFPSKDFFNPYTDEKFYFYAIEPELKQAIGTYTVIQDIYGKLHGTVMEDWAAEDIYDVYAYTQFSFDISSIGSYSYFTDWTKSLIIYFSMVLRETNILRNVTNYPGENNAKVMTGFCRFVRNEFLGYGNNIIYLTPFNISSFLNPQVIQTKNYVFSPRLSKSLFSCFNDSFFQLFKPEENLNIFNPEREEAIQDGYSDALRYINQPSFNFSWTDQESAPNFRGFSTQTITRGPIFGLIQGGEF
jgi:hypothetical protein